MSHDHQQGQQDCEGCFREQYARQARADFLAKWDDPQYPFVRGFGRIHVKGVSSCYPLARVLADTERGSIEGWYNGAGIQLLTPEQASDCATGRMRGGRRRPCRICCPEIPGVAQ